jgi:hypothetical protein
LAEAAMGMDVTGDPDTSGHHLDKFPVTDLLCPILGEALCDAPYAEQSPEQHEVFVKWCELAMWYTSLRRAGYHAAAFCFVDFYF